MAKSVFFIGLFVTVVTAGMGFYVFKSSDVIGTSTYIVYANIQNASGLLVDGSVRVSGVQIGRIKDIELAENNVRLVLEIQKDVELYSEDVLKRIPQGILGSVVLQIDRTWKGTILQDKEYLVNVEENTVMDNLLDSSKDVIGNVGDISDKVQDYLATTDLLERIDGIAKHLEDTVAHISSITGELAINSQVNATNIQTMIQAIATISFALEQFLTTDKTLENQEFSDTLVAIRDSLQNIQDITETLTAGEGTLGKLLKDDTLYTQASETVENINKVTNRAAGLYTDFEYKYEGLISESGLGYTSRNNVNLRISPADSPRHYQIGITTGGAENFTGSPQYTSTIGTSSLKLNLLLAQQFGSMITARGGLIENTGGFGIDFMPIPQLQISAEAFDFGGGNAGAHLRVSSYVYPFFDPKDTYNPLKWIYLGGGVDDILSSYERNYYFGLGIRIQDEFIYDTVRLIPLASAASSLQ